MSRSVSMNAESGRRNPPGPVRVPQRWHRLPPAAPIHLSPCTPPAARRSCAGRASEFSCAGRRSSSAVGNSLPERIIKPASLQPGDKIGIIAPASNFNREAFERGCQNMRRLGYEPVFSDDIFDRDLYFAGSAERRLREFESLLQRDDVAALIGVRGGYGSNYLLERLNFELFTRHPKIILGCSDLTSLLTAISDRTRLVTFHGPMVAKDIAG